MPEERDSEQNSQEPRSGDLNVGGDYVGGDKIVHGDDVRGDKITVGDVTGSTGVAIGRESSAHVEHSQHTTVINPFDEARRVLDELPLPPEDKEEAEFAVQQIENEAANEEPDVDRLDRWLDVLEAIAPAVVEVLVNAITNPGAAVGAGLRAALRAWRLARRRPGEA
jgi:hypothetical protein